MKCGISTVSGDKAFSTHSGVLHLGKIGAGGP